MHYKTPAALESALRQAARDSSLDTGYAVELFVRDRFLCRVFSDANSGFVLKGGLGLLARHIDARTTHDVDVFSRLTDINLAAEQVIALSSTPLDDFMLYRLVSAESNSAQVEHLGMARLIFNAYLGTQQKGVVKLDLIVGCEPKGELAIIEPATRLQINGLKAYKYAVYPDEDTVADKICATIQYYAGDNPSSRVKDLVDLVFSCTRETMSYNTLRQSVLSELRRRNIAAPSTFNIPVEWHVEYAGQFSSLAKQVNLPHEFQSIEAAEQLVQSFIEPVLTVEFNYLYWSPENQAWY